jgi:2-dehydropantoate 2-reductase
VGSVFGGMLALAGHDLWLVHRRREVVEALRRDGLRLETPTSDERIPVQATDAPVEIGPVDLILILTKALDTRAAAEAARPLLGPHTVVVTLQNGLGNLETIADVLGPDRALLGMTYVGATVLGAGHVRLSAPGQSFIGEPDGSLSERARDLARVLSEAGMPTEATDQLWSMVWAKLVINASLNATCALTGANGTTLLRSRAADGWLALIAEETAAVAAALGIDLPFASASERVRQHCRDIGRSKPSMLQDIERGRPTEIDAINGAIVRAGARVGVPTPFNQALLLLVQTREDVSASDGL